MNYTYPASCEKIKVEMSEISLDCTHPRKIDMKHRKESKTWFQLQKRFAGRWQIMPFIVLFRLCVTRGYGFYVLLELMI